MSGIISELLKHETTEMLIYKLRSIHLAVTLIHLTNFRRSIMSLYFHYLMLIQHVSACMAISM